MTRVLVVDDEPQIVRALGINLRARGWDVVTAGDGVEALDVAEHADPDVVVLDLGLPDLDGVDVITRLRRRSSVPVLVLSGRSDSIDKVDALDAGADDYVTKPFGMDELMARLRALVRRGQAEETTPEQDRVAFGRVVVDLAATRVTVDGEEVRLTPTEWHLLEVFVRNPGRLISQRQLLSEVWGPGYENAHGNLRLYMAQLRRKLEPEPSRPVHFRNEPGMGYRFEP
ncbi:DNA-binding response regulator [Nocardioides aromaticivorans]|uniref:DNA-binding response regulator n=1 Tax=Nocardioides aromaticivorans TaxID=200618 RepID=A0ABX7PSA0_9ACTN|nr:response regulator [Nocardioides aromaticivorans]QSR28689.1 DNA-binding response regulator [Nocardioides aromaticivorans]